MTEADTEDRPFVDYLAPFEAFQAYGLRGGTIYRGRVRPEFARDREALRQLLDAAPGTHRLENIDGRLYLTLRTYHGPRPRQRLWLHITLLLIAIVTIVGAGADLSRMYGRDSPAHDDKTQLHPFEFALESMARVLDGKTEEISAYLWPDFANYMARGIPYAVALLFVLLSHEMGHFVAARRYGVDATLPFVIPAPFLFGTLGAIIKMRSPIAHRRSLFDIGAAGPIAGLVASVVVCVIGLSMSSYVPESTMIGQPFRFGTSVMYRGLARLAMGPPPTAPGVHVLNLDPVAIAGWFGLFVTFLNLMPLGQLDGGHICYALLGRRQRYVGYAAFALLVGMGYLFVGWLVLAALVLLLLRIKHPPVMDESVRLGPVRTAVGIVIIILFLLMFVPVPLVLSRYWG